MSYINSPTKPKRFKYSIKYLNLVTPWSNYVQEYKSFESIPWYNSQQRLLVLLGQWTLVWNAAIHCPVLFASYECHRLGHFHNLQKCGCPNENTTNSLETGTWNVSDISTSIYLKSAEPQDCNKAVLQQASVSLLYSNSIANRRGKKCAEIAMTKNWKFLKHKSIFGWVACK